MIAPSTTQPADYLDALVSGLPSAAGEEHLALVLQGHFDDSGSHPEGGAYVLGGFISTIGNWKRFSNDWQAVLRRDPPIDYFKMSEANTLDGQFRGWPAPLRDQRVLELAEVTEKYAVARISAVILQKDFNEHIKGVSPWRELDNPYFLLFYQTITLVADFLHELGQRTHLDVRGAELDFVFDDQGAVGLNALAWWDVFRQALTEKHLRFLGPSPVFRSDRKVLPLQAADLYAWHVRNMFEIGDDEKIRTRAVINALRKIPPYGRHMTAQELKDSVPELIAISEPYRR